ncbi:MAG: ankyrin repeat domain-containing protein [Legionellales bacterium]
MTEKGKIVEFLIKAGAAVNEINDNIGATSLYFAAYQGDVAIMKLLLSAGADPDLADNDGFTPLFRAAENNHFSAVRILLEAGAAPSKAPNNGITPLLIAAAKGCHDVAEYIADWIIATIDSPNLQLSCEDRAYVWECQSPGNHLEVNELVEQTNFQAE